MDGLQHINAPLSVYRTLRWLWEARFLAISRRGRRAGILIAPAEGKIPAGRGEFDYWPYRHFGIGATTADANPVVLEQLDGDVGVGSSLTCRQSCAPDGARALFLTLALQEVAGSRSEVGRGRRQFCLQAASKDSWEEEWGWWSCARRACVAVSSRKKLNYAEVFHGRCGNGGATSTAMGSPIYFCSRAYIKNKSKKTSK